ncbi:MAG: hypothetical protein ACP5OG_06030 [Candidatus Nanoarchaeia archaeon]
MASIYLGLNNTVLYLETCLNSTNITNKNASYYYVDDDRNYLPSREGVEKLKLIQYVKILNPRGNYRNLSLESCESIWSISYKPYEIFDRGHDHVMIVIRKCESDYFITKSSNLSDKALGKTFKINLDEDTADKLRQDKDKCYNPYCYIQKSKDMNDSSICENIDYAYSKDDCYLEYMHYEKNNRVCPKIISNDFKDICYYKSAVYSDNPAGCSYVSYEDIRDLCLSESAKEIYSCNNLSYLDTKDQCYKRVAEYKKDVLICENINSGFMKDYCYRDVAIILNDSLICVKITDGYNKDICYVRIANNTKDPALCDKVVLESQKNDCLTKSKS